MALVDTDSIFSSVKSRFDARDAQVGEKNFSGKDWMRTKIAFQTFRKAKRIIDIGIGQGQLINLFCELPSTEAVIGIDRTRHSKLMVPASPKFSFEQADITEDLPADIMKSDISIAMEVFEHIDPSLLKAAVARAKESCIHNLLFATVPYKEEHPLFHFDKPYGHKQSFDGDVILENFGHETLYANFKDKWYFILSGNSLPKRGEARLGEFLDICERSTSMVYSSR